MQRVHAHIGAQTVPCLRPLSTDMGHCRRAELQKKKQKKKRGGHSQISRFLPAESASTSRPPARPRRRREPRASTPPPGPRSPPPTTTSQPASHPRLPLQSNRTRKRGEHRGFSRTFAQLTHTTESLPPSLPAHSPRRRRSLALPGQ